MIVKDIQAHIEAARRLLSEGNTEAAEQHLDQIAHQLDTERLLTTTQAAELLGIRSKNTIKAMARRGQITATTVGNRFLIPMTEIIRLQDAPLIHELRTIERDYEDMAFPGSDERVSDEEIESMREGRPGTLPWQQ